VKFDPGLAQSTAHLPCITVNVIMSHVTGEMSCYMLQILFE